MEVTRRLARLVTATGWDDLPEAARHEAKRAILNYFAVALAAANDPTIRIALEVFAPFRSPGRASTIGRVGTFDMLNAAALNAMAANVHDFDDTHVPTVLHPTAPVAAALFALAQERPLSGQAFLLAFVLGVETECRIANAISPAHYDRGWHITSTCGVFGAAAACARALGLADRETGWALAAAAAQSCGLVEMLGTSAKSISVGNAARNGLLSALLAAGGFEGPAAPLEGARGFLNVFGHRPDLAAFDEGEAPWQILRNTYKPYPCGVVLNPVIEACMALREHPLVRERLHDVSAIDIIANPLLRQRTDRPGVRSGRESQVSAQHAVGVVLATGKAGLDAFSDAAVHDPRVRTLGEKVRFHEDAGTTLDAATVRIQVGERWAVEEVQHARGSLLRPMTDTELELKLHELCAFGGSGVDSRALAEAVWGMDGCADITDLLALASPRASSS